MHFIWAAVWPTEAIESDLPCVIEHQNNIYFLNFILKFKEEAKTYFQYGMAGILQIFSDVFVLFTHLKETA